MKRADVAARIRESVPITSFLEKSQGGLYCCPFCGSGHHRNHTGALKVYPDNSAICFSTGCTGQQGGKWKRQDVISVFMQVHGVTFPEAVLQLAPFAGISSAEVEANYGRYGDFHRQGTYTPATAYRPDQRESALEVECEEAIPPPRPICEPGTLFITNTPRYTDPSPRDLILYLEEMYLPGEPVHIVTRTSRGVAPGPGRSIPRDVLLDQLHRGRSVTSVLGPWNESAGAWVTINPCKHKHSDSEVISYRHALVESDTISLEEQEQLFRLYGLPITALTYSGGKSLHAAVKVDARNAAEYRERVDFLYGYLRAAGIEIDQANRNPARLTRLPGVTRNGKRQILLGVNIGLESWSSWKRAVTRDYE